MPALLALVLVVAAFMAPTVIGKLVTAASEKQRRKEEEERGKIAGGSRKLRLVEPMPEAPDDVIDDVPSAAEATENLASVPTSSVKVRYDCGHDYADAFSHDFFGETLEVLPEVLASRTQCGECMLEAVKPFIARCARCGFMIMPGEPVTAYAPAYAAKSEWCTRTHDGQGVLGCLRISCTPTEPQVVGFWTENGFKPMQSISMDDLADMIGVEIVEVPGGGGGKGGGKGDPTLN